MAHLLKKRILFGIHDTRQHQNHSFKIVDPPIWFRNPLAHNLRDDPPPLIPANKKKTFNNKKLAIHSRKEEQNDGIEDPFSFTNIYIFTII
jgi:hypothetical protein